MQKGLSPLTCNLTNVWENLPLAMELKANCVSHCVGRDLSQKGIKQFRSTVVIWEDKVLIDPGVSFDWLHWWLRYWSVSHAVCVPCTALLQQELVQLAACCMFSRRGIRQNLLFTEQSYRVINGKEAGENYWVTQGIQRSWEFSQASK